MKIERIAYEVTVQRGAGQLGERLRIEAQLQGNEAADRAFEQLRRWMELRLGIEILREGNYACVQEAAERGCVFENGIKPSGAGDGPAGGDYEFGDFAADGGEHY